MHGQTKNLTGQTTRHRKVGIDIAKWYKYLLLMHARTVINRSGHTETLKFSRSGGAVMRNQSVLSPRACVSMGYVWRCKNLAIFFAITRCCKVSGFQFKRKLN